MVQRRDSGQVRTLAPDGTDPRWLGEYGHVADLKYAYTYPGGASTMSCLLQQPPSFWATCMSPGRTAEVWRGMSRIWSGRLARPAPSEDGWQITAAGTGAMGNDFCDVWTNWRDPNDHVNEAISRGLPWKNPGISTTGIWLGDQSDSASQYITDYLTGATVQGIVSWYVSPRDGTLTVAAIPTAVTRLLACTAPVARDVGDDINRIFLKYQITNDTSGSTTVAPQTATYGLAEASNDADITGHGAREYYYDLTANGVMAESAAQQNGANVLARYDRASFAGAFAVGQGQLLNTGGYPVDLGCEQAGSVVRLMVADLGYGGEVTAGPVTFVVGQYEYDDSTQTAQVTPFQSVADSMDTLLASVFPTRSTPG